MGDELSLSSKRARGSRGDGGGLAAFVMLFLAGLAVGMVLMWAIDRGVFYPVANRILARRPVRRGG